MISAQGVEGDSQHKLLLGDFDHFAALVLTAIRAHTVRELLLMAIGALGKPLFLESVMGAAFARAGCGVSSFRIRHFYFFLN
jgi:hypothetical protein